MFRILDFQACYFLALVDLGGSINPIVGLYCQDGLTTCAKPSFRNHCAIRSLDAHAATIIIYIVQRGTVADDAVAAFMSCSCCSCAGFPHEAVNLIGAVISPIFPERAPHLWGTKVAKLLR